MHACMGLGWMDAWMPGWAINRRVDEYMDACMHERSPNEWWMHGWMEEIKNKRELKVESFMDDR